MFCFNKCLKMLLVCAVAESESLSPRFYTQLDRTCSSTMYNYIGATPSVS
uniref:Uncharacterized protein n=1 Tax=Arundo donax TaxID=35708 RepID=A0A0A9DTU0_ARUDO